MNNSTFENNEDYFHDEKADTAYGIEETLFEKLKRIISISEIFRITGAFAVLASMSLFLLNGWSEGNDINRYLKLLAQTGLLSSAGLLLSFVLKENKGARLFLALSLISIVANFTILGALTYSMFQLDENLIQYPSIVTWEAVNPLAFWPVFAGAVVLLGLLTRFSLSIFARKIAAPLSISFLLMNALLLIPLRSSLAVSIIGTTAVALAFYAIKHFSQNKDFIMTTESKFALSLLFIPGFIIFARALSLYNVNSVLLLSMTGLVYSGLRVLIKNITNHSITFKFIEVFQYVIACIISALVADLLPYSLNNFSIALFSGVLLALTYDQTTASKSAKWHQISTGMSTFLIASSTMVITLDYANPSLQIICALTASTLFAYIAYFSPASAKSKTATSVSLLALTVTLGALLLRIIDLIQLGNWVFIGLIGGGLIIVGSLFERYGLTFLQINKQ